MSFGRTLKTENSKGIEISICIFGDSKSGKSSIINNYCYRKFNENQNVDFKDRVVELVNLNEKFLIQECSDKERIPIICNKSTNLIVTCDLIKVIQNPLLEATQIQDYLNEFKELSSHIILVGTKSDLISSYQANMQKEENDSNSQNKINNSHEHHQLKHFQNEPKRNPTQKRSSSLLIQSKKQIQLHPTMVLKKIADDFRIQYIESSSKDNSSINLIFQLSLGNIQTELFMRDFQQGMKSQAQINQKPTKEIQNDNSNNGHIHLNNNNDNQADEDGIFYYSSCF